MAESEKARLLWITGMSLLWGLAEGYLINQGITVAEYTPHKWNQYLSSIEKETPTGGTASPEVYERALEQRLPDRIEIIAIWVVLAVMILGLPLGARAVHHSWAVAVGAVAWGVIFSVTFWPVGYIL